MMQTKANLKTIRETHIDKKTGKTCIFCHRCQSLKELDLFYIVMKTKRGEYDYSSWCRQCVKEDKQSKVDKRIKTDIITKIKYIECPACGKTKEVLHFNRRNYVYAKDCKSCTKAKETTTVNFTMLSTQP